MKKIKDYISKPSEALQAMVDGLLKQSKRRNFKINMITFGQSRGRVCFGCAATCTIQQIIGKNLTPSNIDFSSQREKKLGLEPDSLHKFEVVIDWARRGSIYPLIDYFTGNSDRSFDILMPQLTSENWKLKLPQIQILIKKLQEKGL